MLQATTPVIVVTVIGHDLTDKTVYLTLARQDGVLLTLSNDRLLIRRETLDFPAGSVQVQVRFIDQDGMALGTDIGTMPVLRVLLREEIAYREEEVEEP